MSTGKHPTVYFFHPLLQEALRAGPEEQGRGSPLLLLTIHSLGEEMAAPPHLLNQNRWTASALKLQGDSDTQPHLGTVAPEQQLLGGRDHVLLVSVSPLLEQGLTHGMLP